jgi:Mrp family chromosome partitioning ATPase
MNFSVGDDARINADRRGAVYVVDASNSRSEDGRMLRDTWAAVRRSWLGLLVWFLLCVSAAVAYVLLATPEFLGAAQVVLEPRQPEIATDPTSPVTAPTLDSAQADSQTQVLQSERNLRFVFDTLNLASDPDYSGNGFNLIGWLQSFIPAKFLPPPLPPEQQAARDREMAYENFANRVIVKRLAQSYAFDVSFRALSAEKAAHLTNSIVAAYIRDQVIYNVAAATAQRGGDFLQNRIADSKIEVETATNAVKTGIIPDFVFGHADSRIVSAAAEPLTKTYPMTLLLLALSVVFALISGVGAVMAREGLNRRIRSVAQVRNLIGIDAIAVIPRVRRRRGRGAPSLRDAIDLPGSPLAAALRVLRAHVLAAPSAPRRASIGVVSCHSGEGKSLIAANLAYSIAASNQAVTLIDADVRNVTLSKALAPTATVSLSEFAASKGVDVSCFQTQLSDHLFFVPGRSIDCEPDPNLFIGSRETLQGIAALTASRDVIIDLPSMNDAADAVAFGRSLTGVLVVAAAGRTTVDELAQLITTLTANDARVLGVVLNKVTA